MQLIGPADQQIANEIDILQQLLPLSGARVLELGCGAAEKTRMIAEQCGVEQIVAAEVDSIQHQKNLQIDDLPDVEFVSFGAEQIEAPDDSFDIVLMFKSLHHVPIDQMDHAFAEIHRVLKPNGLVYISEPVFDGAFNDVIRLFHDEEMVRQAAFDATRRAAQSTAFELSEEVFFKNIMRLQDFGQFERGIVNATFMDHNPSPELLAQVQQRFEANASNDGYVFEIPNRVDLLRKH